ECSSKVKSLHKDYENFQKLLDCWNKLINNEKGRNYGKYKKRKVNLLKSIIGEKCHSHLFDILLRNKEECCEAIKQYLPEEFTQTLDKLLK
ncbi:hypothetical protein, partial [Aquifex sp.]